MPTTTVPSWREMLQKRQFPLSVIDVRRLRQLALRRAEAAAAGSGPDAARPRLDWDYWIVCRTI